MNEYNQIKLNVRLKEMSREGIFFLRKDDTIFRLTGIRKYIPMYISNRIVFARHKIYYSTKRYEKNNVKLNGDMACFNVDL